MVNPSASRCERRGDTHVTAAILEAASGIVPAVSPSSHSPPRPFLGETPRVSHQLGSHIIQMPSKKAGLCSQHVNSAWSCHNLDFQPATTKRVAKEAELPPLPLLLISSRQEGMEIWGKNWNRGKKKWEMSPWYPTGCDLASLASLQLCPGFPGSRICQEMSK